MRTRRGASPSRAALASCLSVVTLAPIRGSGAHAPNPRSPAVREGGWRGATVWGGCPKPSRRE
eukprot:2302200-Pyramimonas_sp.AAC.1